MDFSTARERLRQHRASWLVTGCAGFIGCNLVEQLLMMGQTVIGLDNFATGHRRNLAQVEEAVGPANWARFRFIEGDIRDLAVCRAAATGVDYVLHQAALGSVPRSIDDPILVNGCNVDGFVNMLVAARDAKTKRFVYAASSSTYGDNAELPKIEERIGEPLSPYAVTKYANELYAAVFARTYGMRAVGLRYFNVFGPRQDPNGAYAAVIPKWISAMLRGESVHINGDGETSRDFCYIANVVQANVLAAMHDQREATHAVYNVAVGQRTTLNDLHARIRSELQQRRPELTIAAPVYREFRAGDVRHSLASIDKAERMLGYQPTHTIAQGLAEAMDWYVRDLSAQRAS